MIFTLRGEKIMIDRDLAQLYGIPAKALNQAVKRNPDSFKSYIFQLTDMETKELVTNCDRFKTLRHSTSNPFAFNEHGVLMLSSILKSKTATEINRKIIKVFVELRHQVIGNPDLAFLNEKVRRIESEIDAIKTHQKFDEKLIEGKLIQVSRDINRFSQVLDEFQDSHLIIKRPSDA